MSHSKTVCRDQDETPPRDKRGPGSERVPGQSFESESGDVSALLGECRILRRDILRGRHGHPPSISPRELREFVEKLPAPAVVVGGDEVRLNRAVQGLIGYGPGELPTLDRWFAAVHGSHAAEMRAFYESRHEAGFPDTSPLSLIGKDGRERRVAWTGHVFREATVWLFHPIERSDAPLTDADERGPESLGGGADVTKRHELEARVVRATEEERRRIAQDLHDDLGSLLTSLKLRLARLATELAEAGADRAEECRAVEALIGDAVTRTRRIAKGLHYGGTRPEDFIHTLAELADRTRAHSPFDCQLICPRPVRVADPVVANHLFCIAQEAVNNALKHSGGTEILIILEERDGETHLTITDDGSGFVPGETAARGLGLHIMQFRATAVGGRLAMRRLQSGGTSVSCNLPTLRAQCSSH